MLQVFVIPRCVTNFIAQNFLHTLPCQWVGIESEANIFVVIGQHTELLVDRITWLHVSTRVCHELCSCTIMLFLEDTSAFFSVLRNIASEPIEKKAGLAENLKK